MAREEKGTTRTATHVTPLAIQQEYWDGLIPIQLSLAPTSVSSSPTGGLPPPVHVLVSRCTFLHVALESAVRRFHPYAPSIFLTQLSIQEPDIGDSNHEKFLLDGDAGDAEAGAAPAAPTTTRSSTATDSSLQPEAYPSQRYPICWFEDEETKLAVRWHLFVGVLFDMLHPETEESRRKRRTLSSSSSTSSSSLPWKLKLHFNNYPSSQLLPLEEENVLSSVQFSFRSAWKQALTILTGNSKCAMQMTKESHGLVWEAIASGDCELYHRVDLSTMTAVAIPIRVLVGRTNPPLQKRVDLLSDTTGRTTSMTLRELLLTWCPAEFNASSSSLYTCTVCGIEQTSVLDDMTLDVLYQHCYSPDRFLYILLVEE
jgi:Autophagy protein Apg5